MAASNIIENLFMNAGTIATVLLPMTTVGTLAIFGIMKLLSKQILKQYERNEACELWQEVVCGGFETVPSTNAGGDITK